MVAFSADGVHKSKQLSQSSPSFAQGGHNNHMCSKYGSAAAAPGAFTTQGDNGKWAHGGNTHMLKGNPVRKQKPA